MHYPLHITVLCTTLWILRGDVNAAKTGVSPEVLTSFAKNIASVLSSTLLGELRDSRGNQTDLKLSGTLKKLLDAESFRDDAIENINSKFLGSRPDRSKRLAAERRPSLDDGQRGFQNVYEPRYTNYYDPELYRFPVNRGTEIPRGEAILRAVENADVRANAIDGDVNAAALHYANDYHQPPGFNRKPDLAHHPLVYPPSQYGPHRFHDQYDNRPTPGPSDQPSAVAGIEDEEANGNPQSARVLDNRPYNLNYHDPYRNPHHPYFNNHEIHGHPVNGQSSALGDDQDAQNPSALTEDQNQKGGYIYPSFHYGPFHHGFYGPHYHNGPHNDSHPNGGNNSGPHNRDPYYGGYDPYFGPYHHPHYHNYNGHGRPDQGNENGQNGAQAEGENGNNHGNNHHYGYHDHGPFYGGPYGKYAGFPAFPYKHFGHGFYDPIGPKYKVPFVDPFGPFPLVPYNPYGFYPGPFGPYGPNGQNGHHNNDKPDGNAEKKQPEAAADAEAISEGQSKIVESLSSNQRAFPFLVPVSIKNMKPDCEECSLTIDSRK
ncbi:uncharacterized protein LOC143353861 [Halictus rubicundus]|uniref:uncharacterized protein LOC143353861 n=1 Tax=Halictus rubicundus TaxID=77578 RepID=UPI0040372D85